MGEKIFNSNGTLVGMKGKFILLLFAIFLIHGIFALNVNISVDSVFNSGDNVSFSYSIYSNTTQEISYSTWIKCFDLPSPLLELSNLSLQSNVPYTGTYENPGYLSNKINPQFCNAFVFVSSPEEKTFSKQFYLNTTPDFTFTTHVCKDKPCYYPSKFFSPGSLVYFNYSSGINNLSINALLILPNNKTENISVGTPFNVSQIGHYLINSTAYKEGYKMADSQSNFWVVESSSPLNYTSLSAEKQLISQQRNNHFMGVLLVILTSLLLVVLLIFFLLKKYKKY